MGGEEIHMCKYMEKQMELLRREQSLREKAGSDKYITCLHKDPPVKYDFPTWRKKSSYREMTS